MGKDVKGQGRAGRLVNGPNGLAKEADTVENGFGTLAEKVEVLAPAGSFDSLRAAVAAGADAVYAGGGGSAPALSRRIFHGMNYWKPSIIPICMDAVFI